MSRGLLFVVSAPSGTGKTTVCRRLLERDPGLALSVSHTTRRPRPGEVPGRDYHFVSHREFRDLVERGAFVEFAEYGGNLYGTSEAELERILEQGRDALLEIEVQGAAQIRARRPDARGIFLLPPSLEVLEARLRGRGTDDEEAIQKRLALARRELAAIGTFDYAVVNDDLEGTVDALLSIIEAERRGDPAPVRARYGREAAIARLPWLRRALETAAGGGGGDARTGSTGPEPLR